MNRMADQPASAAFGEHKNPGSVRAALLQSRDRGATRDTQGDRGRTGAGVSRRSPAPRHHAAKRL